MDPTTVHLALRTLQGDEEAADAFMVAVPQGLLSDAGPEEAAERYLSGVHEYTIVKGRASEESGRTPEQAEVLAAARAHPVYQEAFNAERDRMLHQDRSYTPVRDPESYSHVLADITEKRDLTRLLPEDTDPIDPEAGTAIGAAYRDFGLGADLRRGIAEAGLRQGVSRGSLSPDDLQMLGRIEAAEAAVEEWSRGVAGGEKRHKAMRDEHDAGATAPTPVEGRPKPKKKADRSGEGGKFKPKKTRKGSSEPVPGGSDY